MPKSPGVIEREKRRKERAAAELRANLLKRKEQQRQLRAGATEGASPPAAKGTGSNATPVDGKADA